MKSAGEVLPAKFFCSSRIDGAVRLLRKSSSHQGLSSYAGRSGIVATKEDKETKILRTERSCARQGAEGSACLVLPDGGGLDRVGSIGGGPPLLICHAD